MAVLKSPQTIVISAVDYVGAVDASQLVALCVIDFTIAAPSLQSPQTITMVATEATSPPRASQMVALCVYGEGVTGDYRLRAWTFTLDGHVFYVLGLGVLGTYVCDLSTRQWSQWQTAGFVGWNAVQGTAWQDFIVAGDTQNGTIWLVDPSGSLDEGFRPVTRTATALLPQRGRATTTIGELTLNASVGFPTGDDPLVTLSFSDDNGETWFTPEAVTVDSDPDGNQQIAWRSLGTFGAPGRIFDVTDVGGMVRLSDVDMVAS